MISIHNILIIPVFNTSFALLLTYECSAFLLHKLTKKLEPLPGGGVGGGVLGSSFAGYVPLASQNPYPIIVYFWSTLWPIINPILVTFGQMIFLLSKSQKNVTPF